MSRKQTERIKRLTFYFYILTSCLLLLLNVKIAIGYTNITPAEVKTALETEDIFLLDVRTLDEYLDGHIPGAYLIPRTELKDRRSELPVNVTQPIIVYCASGGRSAIASDILDSMGYVDVRNMEGGFTAWPYEIEYGSGTITETSPETSTTVTELPKTTNLPYWISFTIIFSIFLLTRIRHK